MYNYSRLKGRITEKYATCSGFAKAMAISKTSLSAKLNNKTTWRQDEMLQAAVLLDFPLDEVYKYFFTMEVK